MTGPHRGIARDAAIAGTATAVSNRVLCLRAGRWAVQEQQYAEQPYRQQPPYRPEPDYGQAGAEPAADDSMSDKLEQRGELQAQGVLTEQGFQAQKERILG